MKRWLGFALVICVLASFWGTSEARTNPRYSKGGRTPVFSETTDDQEFYNDFSNYDVEISVPASYLVWATGNWQNPEDILNEPYPGDRFTPGEYPGLF